MTTFRSRAVEIIGGVRKKVHVPRLAQEDLEIALESALREAFAEGLEQASDTCAELADVSAMTASMSLYYDAQKVREGLAEAKRAREGK